MATRNVANVYCYESPSATVKFAPARFVDIDANLDEKLAMLAAFSSQSELLDMTWPMDPGASHGALLGSLRSEPVLRAARGGAGSTHRPTECAGHEFGALV